MIPADRGDHREVALRPRPRIRWAIAGFLAVCLALWMVGGGIPYGVDGIEIYFTYLTGYNAATFSQVNPLIADVAASPSPAAHPYSYTHHPNLLANLLSRTLIQGGLADLRWHGLVAILVTAAGLYVGARCIREMVGEPEAIAYVVISSLHYAGVLTWAPVLLRSFHFPFFWVGIWAVQRYVVSASPAALAAAGLWTYVIFLNDFTLGPFLLVAQVMMVMLCSTSWRRCWWFIAVNAAAAVTAVATWIGVLIRQFGWDVVLQDIAYTYIDRNLSPLLSNRAAVVEFYHGNRIVFWNVTSADGLVHAFLEAWERARELGHGPLAVAVYAFVIFALVQPLARRVKDRHSSLKAGGLIVRETISSSWTGVMNRLGAAAAALARAGGLAAVAAALAGVAGLAAFAFGRFRTGRALLTVALGAGAALVLAAVTAPGTSSEGRVRASPGDASWPDAVLAAVAGLTAVAGPFLRPEWFLAGRRAMVAMPIALAAVVVLHVATRRIATCRVEGLLADAAVWLTAVVVGIAGLFALDARLLADLEVTAVGHRAFEVAAAIKQVSRFWPTGFAVAVALAGVSIWWRYWRQVRLAVAATVPVVLAAVGFLGAAAIALSVLRELWGIYGFRAASPDQLQKDAAVAMWLFVGLLGPTAALVAIYARKATGRDEGAVEGIARGLEHMFARPNGRGMTLRAYIVGLVTAIAVLSVALAGPFTGNFVFTYKPSVVFLEDVVLAVLVVLAIQFVRQVPATSYRWSVRAFVVGLAICSWLLHQGVLVYRYPPSELGISRPLKGESFRGASFVEEAMYAAIWYYTGGTTHSVSLDPSKTALDLDALMFFHDRDQRASEYRRPQYLACARQHVEAPYACDRWVRYLEALGYDLREGENMLYDRDYVILRLQRRVPGG